mmetsp:Transcript_41943/g.122735  ORF Transcript_41943/g.122735 Transcript_41943/m.122735 type:complete len:107 (-) Transcript_41943:96-416(-)
MRNGDGGTHESARRQIHTVRLHGAGAARHTRPPATAPTPRQLASRHLHLAATARAYASPPPPSSSSSSSPYPASAASAALGAGAAASRKALAESRSATWRATLAKL